MATRTNILLVEDDPGQARFVETLLDEAVGTDITVTHVDSLSDGMQAVRFQPYDAILLDLNLPDSYGLDTAEDMLKVAHNIPVIILTGDGDNEAAVAAIRAGAQDFINKNDLTATLLLKAARYAVERKSLEADLTRKALYDDLTGLPNRRLLFDRMAHAIARAKRSRQPMVIYMLDVNDFKAINDKAGHRAGDAVLKEVADRLKSVLRDGDTVARLSGDEFVVVVENQDSLSVSDAVKDKISKLFSTPIEIDTQTFPVSVSVGAVTYDGHGVADDVDNLLHRADIAMYDAKKRLKSSRCSAKVPRLYSVN